MDELLTRYGELDDATRADPHPWHERLRERGEVHPATLPDGRRVWVVVGYRAARVVFSDPRFSNDPAHRRDAGEFLGDRHMGVVDAPDHKRLRNVVSRHFAPNRTAPLRQRVQRVTDDLVDGLAGPVDLVADFAAVLPLRVVFGLFGIAETEQDELLGPMLRLSQLNGGGAEAPLLAEAVRESITRHVERRAAEPGDDILSTLVAARDAGVIDHSELMATVFLLLSAGHETTVNLLAVGMFTLLRHPDQFALLRRRPGLLPTAVEELLRFETTAAHSTGRYTTEDVDLGGVRIPGGELVLVNQTAANRDPDCVGEPERLDLTRKSVPHLAFGHGRHICLGAPLARLEAQVALSTLLSRYSTIRLAVEPERLDWKATPAVRGLIRLPVVLTR